MPLEKNLIKNNRINIIEKKLDTIMKMMSIEPEQNTETKTRRIGFRQEMDVFSSSHK